MRTTGRVPAVIYGRHNPPQRLEFDVKDIKDVMHGAGSEIILLDLSVKDDPKPKRLALLQEIQHHVLTHELLHVDAPGSYEVRFEYWPHGFSATLAVSAIGLALIAAALLWATLLAPKGPAAPRP